MARPMPRRNGLRQQQSLGCAEVSNVAGKTPINVRIVFFVGWGSLEDSHLLSLFFIVINYCFYYC